MKHVQSFFLVGVALVGFCSSAYAINCNDYSKNLRKNINLVIESSDTSFNKKKSEHVYEYFSSKRYIQHSPGVTDGVENIVSLIEYMKNDLPSFQMETVRALAENDFVLTQSVDYIDNEAVEVSFDWYRVNDGKITEHWDVISEYDKNIDASIYTSGPNVNLEICLDKEKIRSIALDYFYETWDKMSTQAIEKHVADNFIQHNPSGIVTGKSDKVALIDMINSMRKNGYNANIEISKVIVTGDFAAVHAKWSDNDGVYAVTDLLRFDEKYKIVEHWDGLSSIPVDNVNPRDAVF
ncbi:nuclear transport factor 2 family protein [Vibrio hannami]|uniref:nuclear transport factor 2 family protein n=1 Tax=Vibrio hannami TaxID=2717094 RepID=UPI00240ED350|nr:nuclear transport factor 2 family protein [Vibrio hannami]MDG3085543.1 nuclear transport factor 2 family protein [Vibrio hannami]